MPNVIPGTQTNWTPAFPFATTQVSTWSNPRWAPPAPWSLACTTHSFTREADPNSVHLFTRSNARPCRNATTRTPHKRRNLLSTHTLSHLPPESFHLRRRSHSSWHCTTNAYLRRTGTASMPGTHTVCICESQASPHSPSLRRTFHSLSDCSRSTFGGYKSTAPSPQTASEPCRNLLQDTPTCDVRYS